MSAQPIRDEPDPRDPAVILVRLPERERPFFLQQYRAAMAQAYDDPAKYKDLRRLLHRYNLVVVAASQPGYYEALDEARAGIGETVPFFEALEAELARRL